jgi:hypothetical protein
VRGLVGADAAARALADGYTLYLGLHSTIAILPTTVEAGLPQLQGDAWFGLFAPVGTPRRGKIGDCPPAGRR